MVSPIRKEMAKQSNEFDGKFNNTCQIKSVPMLLLRLVSSLIDGNSGNGNGFSQEVLTVAQMIMFHQRQSSKKAPQAVVRRHKKTQETPVMVYLGLKLYSITRSRNIIYCIFQLGMCISYDRVLEITKNIYENLHKSYVFYKYPEKGIVYSDVKR